LYIIVWFVPGHNYQRSNFSLAIFTAALDNLFVSGLAPQAFHPHMSPLAPGPPTYSSAGMPHSNSNSSPLPYSTSPAAANGQRSSPPLPYLPAARRQEMNSSPEGSIPTDPSPLPMASAAGDSPQAMTPPPPLIFGGSMNGSGWPHSSFFNLSNSPQHRSQQQQQQSMQHHQMLMGQFRPAVPPFGGAFSPFQVPLVDSGLMCFLILADLDPDPAFQVRADPPHPDFFMNKN